VTRDAHGNRRRSLFAVLAFPAVVAASSGVLALTHAEDLDAVAAAVLLVPIAVYGAVVGRLWIVSMPIVWSAVYLAILRLVDLATGSCSVCGSDEDWGNYPWFFLFIGVLPMTISIVGGLLVGTIARGATRPR
jgi:hypothetical protein